VHEDWSIMYNSDVTKLLLHIII